MKHHKIKLLILTATLLALVWSSPAQAEVQSMTLAQAEDWAMAHSPSIQLAQEKLSVAQAQVGQALAVILPTVKLDSSYSRVYNTPTTMTIPPLAPGMPPTEITLSPTDPFNVWLTQASVSQLIFSPSIWPSWRAAWLGRDIAKEGLRQSRQELIYQVDSAYFALEKAAKLVEVAKEGQTLAQDYLNQVQAIFKAGVNTKADVLEAQVKLANANQALIRAQNGQAVAQTVLDKVLNLPDGQSAWPAGDDLDPNLAETFCSLDSAKLDEEYQRLDRLAYQKRPDWLQAQLTSQVYEQNIAVVSAAALPSLFASASYDWQKAYYLDQPEAQTRNWAVAGGVSWTLFDGNATASKIDEAKATARVFEQQKQLLSQKVDIEVKSNLLELGSAASLITGAKTEVDLAKENYRMALLKYNNDVGTSLEVTTAQTSLTQAETNLAQSQFDYKLTRARLMLAVGVLGEEP